MHCARNIPSHIASGIEAECIESESSKKALKSRLCSSLSVSIVGGRSVFCSAVRPSKPFLRTSETSSRGTFTPWRGIFASRQKRKTSR